MSLVTRGNSPLPLGRLAADYRAGGQSLAQLAHDRATDVQSVRAAMYAWADQIRAWADDPAGLVTVPAPQPVPARPVEPVPGPLGAGPARIPERLREHGWLWGLVHRTGRAA